MINELYGLSLALEKYHLLQSSTHPNVTQVGKSDVIIVEVNAKGEPKGLRFIQKAKMPELWKHSKGNHNSFPAIRIQKPLLAISESKKIDEASWKKAKLTEKINLLLSLDFNAMNANSNEIMISEWSLNELKPVIESDLPELAALKDLLNAFPSDQASQHEFLSHLLQLMHDKIVDCNDEMMLNGLKLVLVGQKESNGRYKSGIMTYYDAYGMLKYENYVFSKDTQIALVQLLNSFENREDAQEKAAIKSPLSGKRTVGVGAKYPNPNLPLLGLTYLYSKKADTPCLSRYHLTGAKAYQAGKSEINKINDAISFLTQPDNENKTWRAVSDSNSDKQNLLLAYIPDEPKNDAFLAKILSNPFSYEDNKEFSRVHAESAYKAICEKVLKDMEGILNRNKEAKVCLILLGTLDPGRKQVIYESAFSVEQLTENMRLWDSALKNYPPYEIKIWNKKEIANYEFNCLGPDTLCRLFKTNYNRSGKNNTLPQSDVTLQEIYNLYMPSSLEIRNEALIDHFLQLSVNKAKYLLGDIGQQLTLDHILSSSMKTQAENAAAFMSLYSVLLYLKGIRKENYMLDAPFNIGQLLKLTDMLHKEYTIQVRNNGSKTASLPSQLMGNELLPIVSEKPLEGLVRLKDRIRIYQAWAYTAVGENSRKAKWILARFEEICLKIAENEIPENFTTAQQAQVLLGYLAVIPYEKKKEANNGKMEEITNE